MTTTASRPEARGSPPAPAAASGAPHPVRRRRRRFSRRTRDALLGYALVMPSLLVFGTFVFYPFVKNFWLGLYRTPPMNTIEARVVREGEEIAVGLPGARVPLPEPLGKVVADRALERVVVGVRPEHLLIAADGIVPATVTVVESLGHERNVACRLDDGTLIITRQEMDEARPAVGETVRLTTEPQTLHVFDARTGLRVDAVDAA